MASIPSTSQETKTPVTSTSFVVQAASSISGTVSTVVGRVASFFQAPPQLTPDTYPDDVRKGLQRHFEEYYHVVEFNREEFAERRENIKLENELHVPKTEIKKTEKLKLIYPDVFGDDLNRYLPPQQGVKEEEMQSLSLEGKPIFAPKTEEEREQIIKQFHEMVGNNGDFAFRIMSFANQRVAIATGQFAKWQCLQRDWYEPIIARNFPMKIKVAIEDKNTAMITCSLKGTIANYMDKDQIICDLKEPIPLEATGVFTLKNEEGHDSVSYFAHFPPEELIPKEIVCSADELPVPSSPPTIL